MKPRQSILLALVLLAAPGCLPYACNRVETRSLAPADSLSRTYGASIPVDTLRPTGALTTALEYPRTVLFGPSGELFVTDTGAHRLLVADAGGRERLVELDGLRYPYLAGLKEGRPVIYSPEAHRLAAFRDGRIFWQMPTPREGPERGGLRYALVSDEGVWFKVLGEGFGGALLMLDEEGNVAERTSLPGEFWRYAGMLRWWLGQPTSLSGYRPIVHRLGEAGLDSLPLFGFDSPMLPRSNQFLLGNVDQPPLLTASAAASDSLLFVLNMRPGWLRIDVFGPRGRMKYALVEPDPAFGQDFFPTDIAVRSDSAGWDLAVTVAKPEAAVLRYRWSGPDG